MSEIRLWVDADQICIQTALKLRRCSTFVRDPNQAPCTTCQTRALDECDQFDPIDETPRGFRIRLGVISEDKPKNPALLRY